jgi:ribosome-binding protein aMBF1 (putative translation factor)
MSNTLDTRKLDNLTNEDLKSINRKYKNKVTDVLLQKKYDNLEMGLVWKSVKNNNKTNKFKNKNNVIHYKSDPYKFLKIPVNMREIIMNLCEKNKLSLQMLAVKTDLKLSMIDSYINNNYSMDNYYLHIILNYLDFDLVNYIDKMNNNE